MNTKCKIKNAYDESALQYDSFVDCGNSHNSIAESPAVYKLLTDIENKNILDLCCGSGRYSLWMARRGAKITGIDYSKKLIKIAREKADKESLAINFIESDIEKVDLGKRKYDGIIIGMGIGYIRNVGKLLGEIAKHLKINGWIIISTNHPIRESGEYIKDKEGNIGRTVFTYFSKKPRMVEWKHMQSITGKKFEVPIYPHSIEEIVSALFNSSIYITNIFEPRPSKNNLCESELIKRMACCQQFIIYRGIKVRM